LFKFEEFHVAKQASKLPRKSVRDEKYEFGKDRRRRHHHYLVTVNYADGETLAAFIPIRTRPRDSRNASGARPWSSPRASARYPEAVSQLQQMHCFELVFGVVACYKIRG